MNFNDMHAGRALVLPIFNKEINNLFKKDKIRVAVFGGIQNEPELLILQKLYRVDVSFFGIENDIFLDLNRPIPTNLGKFENSFDLVICNQVLEHVYDVKQALLNLSTFTKQNGYIWVTCPSSNHKHASPEFYSAGYQSRLIQEILRDLIVPVTLGEVGSKRLYFMTHKQMYWPTKSILEFPFKRGSEIKRYTFPLKIIKHFLKSIQAATWSNKFENGTKYATETYFFGKKV